MTYGKPYFSWLAYLCALCCWPASVHAQWVFERVNVQVSDGGGVLRNPWFGGLNNPQFSTFDLNNDGTDDLVVVERGVFEAAGGSGSKLLTFINNGTPNQVDYTYAPQYEKYFPQPYQWMLLEDFNCDGINDIFASFPGQVDLYLGHYDAQNKPFFTYRGFLPYQTFTGPLNIYVSSVDIPAITDVNGDGDLDIITFQQFGITIDYYENLSQELTGTCGDTLAFKYADVCWGQVWETGLRKAVLLDTCTATGKDGGGGVRHTGSTIMAYDEDGDGDKEIVLGDISFNNLNRLLNGGTPDTAHIVEQDTFFPVYDHPVEMQLFPAGFYLDVNNDGKRDMVVAPNATRHSLNHNCAWFYEDVSADDTVRFQFQTDSFMVNTTIDMGEGAYPAFFDYNGDGLLDIVAGNHGYFLTVNNYKSGLSLFRNTGTAANPAFELVTRDYEGLSNILVNGKRLLGLKPAFGDMDGDGDEDMIVGDTSGKLSYFRNDPAAGVAHFTLINNNYFSIDAGSFSAPFIYDINGDGAPDLLVGQRQGTVQYYENRGTAASPDFDPVPANAAFGQVDVRFPQFINGYSNPVVTRLDGSSQLYLLSGNEEGKIVGYYIDETKLYSGAFRKVFNFFSGIDEGERSALAVADLDNDGKLEMISGSYRGGLGFYRQGDSLAAILPVGIAENEVAELDAKLYPNPATDELNISLPLGLKQAAELTIYDVLGRETLTAQLPVQADGLYTLDISSLQRGLYLCTIRTGQQNKTLRVIKL